MEDKRSSTFRLSQFARGLTILSLALSNLSAAVASVETVSGDSIVFVGDTIRLQIRLEGSEQITGVNIYLSLDNTLFEPILYGDDNDKPFIDGPLINPAQGGTHINRVGLQYGHLDHWHLDYTRLVGSNQQPVSVAGIAAFVDLKVLMLTPTGDPASIVLSHDSDTFNNRISGIIVGGAGATPIRFGVMNDLELILASLAILPPLPDSLMIPGTSRRIRLGDHFSSALFDSSEGTWSYSLNNFLPADVTFDMGTGPNDSLIITTMSAAHGIIDVTVRLDSPLPQLFDTQLLRIVVDNPPVFAPGMPIAFQYDEDDSIVVVGATMFMDSDDSGPDISVRLEPSSPILVRYDTVAESIAFSADPNYFGITQSRLYVEDILGVGIDTLLTFTVNAINDTPVVDFSSLSDTVIIHRDFPDTLDLGPLVSDVDNLAIAWTMSNPDPTNLATTILTGGLLRLLAGANSSFIDIDLVLTATDSLGAGASGTLVVSIRSWPPEIGTLPDINILAGTPYSLELNSLVTDLDTPPSAMTWSFAVTDFATGVPDPQVTINYDPATQIVTFTTVAGYAALDLLELTVIDDDNNTDIDTTRLTVFPTLSPVIYPLDTVVVFRDSITAVLDLDDFVADPVFTPAQISWSATGGDSLAGIQIGDSDHVLTLVTDPFFFGWDSITFVATNPDTFSDTSMLVVRVIPRSDGPPVWSPLANVEIKYPDVITLFTLSDVCKDDFTLGSQLLFTGVTNPNPAAPLTLTITPATQVASISVPALDTYDTWVLFSAEDNMGQVSISDTMTIIVVDSYSPVWIQPPSAAMQINETFSGLFLQDYLSDRDTPISSLTITFNNPNPLITVSYDSATTELTIVASGEASESRITFTATDPEGNSSTIQVRVFVRANPDIEPPEGGLTYHFNPATDKWIHFVLVSDSTSVRFTTTYIYNSREVALIFTQIDSLPGAMTWIAPYRFAFPGVYALTAELIDQALLLSPFRLTLSVAFSKAKGGRLSSPDQLMTVTYPPQPGGGDKLVILSERPGQGGLAKALPPAGPGQNQGNDGFQTVYSLDSNLPEPMMVTLTYHMAPAADPYYSFYRLAGYSLERMDTYTSAEGQFEALVQPGADILFGRSEMAADRSPLPNEELFCYPNPFNATIQVRFMLRSEDRGRIAIYDLRGHEVAASPHQLYQPGVHTFNWRGVDDRGAAVPSGIYFVQLVTDGGRRITRKVTLLK